jgi:hypothetical protein
MCHPGRVRTHVGLAALLITLVVAGCGGDSGDSPEQEDFIVELEIPLSSFNEDPDVFGQAGLSPNGRNGTRIVIRLDEPFKATMEAGIRRGGCSGRFSSDDYELGTVKHGRLTTEVDVPTSELRKNYYALIVREPRDEKEPRTRRRRDFEYDKGTCGDLTTSEPTE